MKGEVLAWAPAVVWVLALAGLSRMTGVPEPLQPFTILSDKVIHFGLYSVLGVALGWARLASRRTPSHLFMVALGSLYGALDEYHQSFVPGRTPEVGDWVANTLGVLAGYALFTLVIAPRSNHFNRTTGDA